MNELKSNSCLVTMPLRKSKDECKDHESIQVPYLTQDTILIMYGKVTKYKKMITHKRVKRSVLSQQGPQGCNEQTKQYDRQTRTTNTKRDPQKKHCLGTVSKKITRGLNMFDGTNPTLISDVDQNTLYMFGSHERSLIYQCIIS